MSTSTRSTRKTAGEEVKTPETDVPKKLTRSAMAGSVEAKEVAVSKPAAKTKPGSQVSLQIRSSRSAKRSEKADSEGEHGEIAAPPPSTSPRRKSPAQAGPSEQVDTDVSKGSKGTPATVTPVRRSSRAPVPSSRFKDMITRKRSGASVSEGTDTESDTEPARKRAKKNSELSETSTMAAETVSNEGHGGSKEQQEVHAETTALAGEPEQQAEHPAAIQEVVAEVPIIMEQIVESEDTPADTQNTVDDVITSVNADVDDQNTQNSIVISVDTSTVTVEASSTEPAKNEDFSVISEIQYAQTFEEKETNSQNAVIEESSATSVDNQAAAGVPSISVSEEVVAQVVDNVESGLGLAETIEETVMEEVVVETVEPTTKSRSLLEQHLHDAMPPRASSAMEGNYALIEEKDLVAVQSAIAHESPGMSRNIQQALSGLDGIDTSSKQITLTERDGQTVAIITIAPPGPPAATQSVENVHGHIVEKSAELTNVITGSSPGYINVAVEPTNITQILAPDKPAKLSAKPGPSTRPNKNIGGRVLRPESSAQSGRFIKTLGVNAVAQVATPPRQTYSLLSGEESSTEQTVAIQGSSQKVVIVGQQPQVSEPSALSQALQGTLPAESVAPSSALSQALQGTLPPDSVSPASKAMLGSQTKVLDKAKEADGVQQKISTLGLPPAVANLLLHKLKEQPGRVIIKESINSAKLIQGSKASSNVLVVKDEITTTTDQLDESTSANITITGTDEQVKEVTVNSSQQSTDGSLTESGQSASEGTEKDQDGLDVQTAEPSLDESRTEMPGDVTATVESEKLSSPDDTDMVEDPEQDLHEETVGTVVEVKEGSNDKAEEEEGEASFTVTGEGVEVKTEVTEDDMSATEEDAEGKEDIHVTESGIQYKVKILSDSEAEASGSQGLVKADEHGMVIIKQEMNDGEMHEESVSLQNLFDGKQTAGTQTAYSSKDGDSVKKQIFTASDGPIHKLATVVSEEGQRRQYFYVSVMLNKDYEGKGAALGGRGGNSTPCVVNEEGMYCCGKCSYKTDRKANFYKHRRLHSGTKPHTCQVCNYRAGTSSNLKRHMGIHEDIRQHKCDLCGLCFRQKIHLERHIKYKHEEKRVQCPLCSYVCANEQPDLRMHMKRKHCSDTPGSQVCVCPTCQASFPSKRDLKQHLKFHRDGPELKLFCKECSFVTDCKSRLKRHAAIHEKVKPFMCSLCQYRAAQKEHVLRHLRTQHKIEVKRQHKRAWKRRSLPEKPAEIPAAAEPPKTSKEKADFSSGDKIFACNHCTMRFAKLINLYKHLHTQHSDIMPPETEGNYYCVVCEFFTHTKKALLIHMRRHNITDQTPPTHVFSCVLCRYVTPRRRNLFQHMRKKHSIDISQQDELDDEGQQETTELKTEPPDPSPGGKVVCDDLVGVANMIKIEDLTRVGSIESSDLDPSKLVIDTRTSRADAAEGLQALAQQVASEPIVSGEEVIHAPVVHAPVVTVEETAVGEAVVSEAVIGEAVVADATAIAVPEVTDAVVGDVVVNESVAQESVELTEDQLAGLQSGDLVEMDGQLYLVELTPDPTAPDRQLLSFLPVNSET